ncbi:vacuolar fusion protein CCZ1 homolog isoform X2 [Cylas formicarius]|nr:vacuolar fusion protein CCZ1 homolog isoform X2 [Cylas formicarius]
MTLNLALTTNIKESVSTSEYLQDDLQDNIYEARLKQAYYMYRLFCDCILKSIEDSHEEILKSRLELFFNAYLVNMNLSNCDILDLLLGIQYMPLDKQTFLNVQCFISMLECKFDFIERCLFLYNEHVIWNGLEPTDLQIIYQYLIRTLLPANVETELKGGSVPRNLPSPFAASQNGRFITGPTNLKQAKVVGKVPKVHLFSVGTAKEYHLIIYRSLSATVCLFVKGEVELTLDMFKEVNDFMVFKLVEVVTDIAEFCSKRSVVPSNHPETTPRFIYFDKTNKAYRSTVHLDNKRSGNICCNIESLRIIADMNENKHLLGPVGESIVKTMNEFWVVSKTSNSREFYVVLQQKNASLIEISEEVKKLCDSELKGIFFHS